MRALVLARATDGVFPFLSVHKQIKVLKDQISELSKTNYELEREVRLFDQRIGLLIAYKKAIEVFVRYITKLYFSISHYRHMIDTHF